MHWYATKSAAGSLIKARRLRMHIYGVFLVSPHSFVGNVMLLTLRFTLLNIILQFCRRSINYANNMSNEKRNYTFFSRNKMKIVTTN